MPDTQILPAISLKVDYISADENITGRKDSSTLMITWYGTGVVVDNFSSGMIKYPFLFLFSVCFLRVLQSFRYFCFQIEIV